MSKMTAAFGFSFFLIVMCAFSGIDKTTDSAVYTVSRLKKQPLKIDGNWDKPQWKKVKEISISNYMGELPAFQPVAKAKMMYDHENLYFIFLVKDRHVRIQTQNFNGPVSGDACVEFFFSPDSNFPERYFNLEINAGGTALMGYHSGEKRIRVSAKDFETVEIAHSLPAKLDQEISEPVTWTIECRLPLDILKKFSNVTHPGKGVTWRANFFKTSSKSSNPHYLTWSFVDYFKPQFHLPQFFGTLKFK